MTNKRFRTAASYLRVLQNMRTPVIARKCATKLLGCALDSEVCAYIKPLYSAARWSHILNQDLELVQDLMRFLDPVEDMEEDSLWVTTKHLNECL